MGFRSVNCNGHCKTWLLFLLNRFRVDFDACLESLSDWTIYLRPNRSFLAEATRFAKISWYFVEFIVSLILNSTPGLLAAKHLQDLNNPPPYLTVGIRCFSLYEFHFDTNHIDGMAKMFNWSHLTLFQS